MALASTSVFDQPVYRCRAAAHYAGLSYATLRRWLGPDGVIKTPSPAALSFNNLAEAHILKAMRRVSNLPLQRIRRALTELSTLRSTAHPLLDDSFERR
jgi:hypothetical protein